MSGSNSRGVGATIWCDSPTRQRAAAAFTRWRISAFPRLARSEQNEKRALPLGSARSPCSRLLRALRRDQLAGRLQTPDVEVARLVRREVDPSILRPHRVAGVG